ncbi:DUF3892 domain-containing protein [Pseudomonas aeruginosa]|uniref:DUF3892 domain-containing protein n=1 Tax=Pseudomonas aeruginosa TaxID=287 RepID=UPI000F8272EE|nr:DUF3892 domain-containing protein [Pseudomonas aeruginosa]RTW74891.1 DUF3892 domain-containing protein [Pseudomonas aeruginosa]
MTDFCISAVRYDPANQHIATLKVHEDKGTKVGPARIVPREFIVDLIRLGKATFQTIRFNKEKDVWEDGALVHVFDGDYLSTDRNDIAKDNLSKLPTF